MGGIWLGWVAFCLRRVGDGMLGFFGGGGLG